MFAQVGRCGKAFFRVAIKTNQTEMLNRPREPRPDWESPEHTNRAWLKSEVWHRAETGGVSDVEIAF